MAKEVDHWQFLITFLLPQEVVASLQTVFIIFTKLQMRSAGEVDLTGFTREGTPYGWKRSENYVRMKCTRQHKGGNFRLKSIPLRVAHVNELQGQDLRV